MILHFCHEHHGCDSIPLSNRITIRKGAISRRMKIFHARKRKQTDSGSEVNTSRGVDDDDHGSLGLLEDGDSLLSIGDVESL